MIKALIRFWHILTVPFMLFTIWLWYFPMFGPLLMISGVDINTLFILFLLSHAVGLLFYSVIIDKLYQLNRISSSGELKLILFFSSLLALLTFIFPYLSSPLLIFTTIMIGLFSGPIVVFYLYYLTMTAANGIYGRILGFILFLAGLVYALLLLLPVNGGMYILSSLLILGPFLLMSKPLEGKDNKPVPQCKAQDKKYWFLLIVVVFMFYVGGGLMYNLLYLDIISSNHCFNIGFLFYPLVILPAGFIADRWGRTAIINTALCFSALGFLLLFIIKSMSSIALVFLQSSFAIMDLFVLLTIMDWTVYFNNRKIIGAGLFLNVIIIFISSLPFLQESISGVIAGEYWPLIGLVFVILTIPLLLFVKDTFPATKESQESSTDLEDFFTQYSLTPREKEVVSLLLAGNDTGTITDLLSISYNTLKTHLRNIYRKTETGSRNELLLLIWEKTK